MQISEATTLLRNACAIRHFSLKTEKSYTYWLQKYCAFLQTSGLKDLSSEKKIEAFLTHLAHCGVSASTQNQAFNALLFFYKVVLNQPLSNISSLRARQHGIVRQAPTREEVFKLLANVSDVYRYPTSHSGQS